LRTVLSLMPRALGDVGVAEAVGDEQENLALAGRQLGERRIVLVGAYPDLHEITYGITEPSPGRLVLQQDVVLRIELHELRARDACRQEPSFRERHYLILTRVQDECRDADCRQLV